MQSPIKSEYKFDQRIDAFAQEYRNSVYFGAYCVDEMIEHVANKTYEYYQSVGNKLNPEQLVRYVSEYLWKQEFGNLMNYTDEGISSRIYLAAEYEDYIAGGYRHYLDLTSQYETGTSISEFIAAYVWNRAYNRPDYDKLKAQVRMYIRQMLDKDIVKEGVNDTVYIYRVYYNSGDKAFVCNRMLSDLEVRQQIQTINGWEITHLTCDWSVNDTHYVGDYFDGFMRYTWSFEKASKI